MFKINVIDTKNIKESNIHKYILKKNYKYYTSTGINFIEHNKNNFEKLKSDRNDYLKNINIKSQTHTDKIYVYNEDNPYLIINHYILRSKEEYQQKIDNNTHRNDRYNVNIFNNLDSVLNTIEDMTILSKI